MTLFPPIAVPLLWICAILVVYVYCAYPMLVWCLAQCFGQRHDVPALPEDELPFVSLLIAAYNEEAVIEKRIQSALAMDYPRERLQIVVASDGSTDRTAEIVRRYAARGVVLLNYRERHGKAAVLNSSFPELKGAVVLLSDANTQIDPSALRKLVRWFQLPEVGVVCGRLILTDSRTGRNVDGLYWKYETFLKRCDGRLGALLGANGAIYAIRHQLFTPLPRDTIVDDLMIPLQAKLRTGCAMIYDCEAVAREETSPDVGCEFRRRARIGAGGFQSIGLLWRLLDPRHGWIAFSFLSHKIGRWISPFCLLGLLAGNLLLLGQPFYRATMTAQLSFYLVALLAARLPGRPIFRVLRLSTMFTLMNAALFVGFCRWLRGSQNGVWQRTERSAEPDIALSGPSARLGTP